MPRIERADRETRLLHPVIVGDAQLESIEGVGEMRAKEIREGLRRLQEINLVDRYMQS